MQCYLNHTPEAPCTVICSLPVKEGMNLSKGVTGSSCASVDLATSFSGSSLTTTPAIVQSYCTCGYCVCELAQGSHNGQWLFRHYGVGVGECG